MRKLNDFFYIINKENIHFEERNLNHYFINGIYFKIPSLPPTIVIEKTIVSDRCKYISILAEELGHHFTTIGNLIENSNTYAEELLKIKKEKKTKLWAADF